MALKFLNKKGWHTGSLRNIENVWKAEQKNEAEKRKLEELKKQIHDEREAQEFRLLQEQAGLVPKQERLEFLYDSGLAVGRNSSDDYLLGKPVEETKREDDVAKVAAAPGALFVEEKPQSANDAWRKLHTDPLLLIRQQEQAALARIRNNPVKMGLIKKSVEENIINKEKRKHKDKQGKDLKEKRRKKQHADNSDATGISFDKKVLNRHETLKDTGENSKREGRLSKKEAPPDGRGNSPKGRYSSPNRRHEGSQRSSESPRKQYDSPEKRRHGSPERGRHDNPIRRHESSQRSRESPRKQYDSPERRRRGSPERGRHDNPIRRHESSQRSRESLRKQYDSPERRQQGTPERRRHDSPIRRHESSQRSRESPQKNYDSSERIRHGSLERRRHDSPERRQDRPKRRHDSPERRQDRPKRRHDSPDSFEAVRRKQGSREDGEYCKSPHADIDSERRDTSKIYPQKDHHFNQSEGDKQKMKQQSKRLTEEEKAARLKEMQNDAEVHEEQRWHRLKKASDADRLEEARRSSTSSGRNFVDQTARNIYGAGRGGSASVEESVRRRTHFIERSIGDSNFNTFQRS